jgi:glycosyltransferase involved in cell wall biosynthesis
MIAASDTIDVSVVICTYNRAKYLGKCIDSIARQTFPSEKYELIVVDNNSSDNTAQVVDFKKSQYPSWRLRYILEVQQGLSYSRNRGMREACGKYVLYIDDDAYADEQWIESIVNCFENFCPRPVCIGGKILLDWEGKEPNWLSERYRGMLGYLNYGKTAYLNDDLSLAINGGNIAFDRAFFLSRGYNFPGSLGRIGDKLLYGEETLVIRRLLEDKAPVCYLDEALVWHVVLPERRSRSWFIKRVIADGRTQPLLQAKEGRLKQSKLFLIRRIFYDFRLFLLWAFKALTQRLRNKSLEYHDSFFMSLRYWGRVISETRMLFGRN